MRHHVRDADRKHLWHPYCDMAARPQRYVPEIVSALGTRLHTADGRTILDGIASWWCVALGHGQPRVVEAIRRQSEALQHTTLGTFTHAPAAELAARLAALAPGDCNRVYYAADGASAVEAALKIAVQYWSYRGEPKRSRFVTLEHAYHGDTIGAMGVSTTSWFRDHYAALLDTPWTIPSPAAPGASADAKADAERTALDHAERLLADHGDRVAAVVIEPLIQGAGGVRFYGPEFLRGLRGLCDRYGTLLIADEIATGFFRTGRLWACDHAGVVPDILCIGKAVTNGTLPLSAALAREHVYEAFLGPSEAPRVFWDGHTFCGNPITCAAALATLDAFAEAGFPRAMAVGQAALARAFAALSERDDLEAVEVLGMVARLAIPEALGGAARARQVADRALENGLFTRPLGPVLYLWPPLTATPEEVERMAEIVRVALDATLDAFADGTHPPLAKALEAEG